MFTPQQLHERRDRGFGWRGLVPAESGQDWGIDVIVENSTESLIHTTTSLCRICKNAVPAVVIERQDATVWMRKVCEVHGQQEVVLSNNASWYRETRLIEPVEVPPASFPVPVDHGCPFDCGPCEEHTQKIRLPVVTWDQAGETPRPQTVRPR